MSASSTVALACLGRAVLVLLTVACLVDHAAAQSCVQPPNGLVSWWSGDADAADLADQNHGTLTNGASAGVAGLVGGAFGFDGQDDHVAVPDASNLDFTDALTVDAWVKPDALNDPFDVSAIASKWMEPTTFRSWIFGIFNSGELFFMVSDGGTDAYVLSNGTVPLGTFSHVAVAYDAGTVDFYIDGAKETTSLPITSMNTTNNLLTLGARHQIFDTFFHFDGVIDEVEVFNRALNSSEVNAIVAAGSAGKCKATNVAIDVKPGSDPNCVNINGQGVIPVAILGAPDLDVENVDATTLSFAGLSVRVRGNRGPLCSVEHVNQDSFLDLVCHFEDDADNWMPGGDAAILTGALLDGSPIEGTDSICVVPGS